MPIFEYVCQRCGALVERLTDDAHKDGQYHYPCGQLMVRRPSSGSFSIKGFNAANGYASKGDPRADV